MCDAREMQRLLELFLAQPVLAPRGFRFALGSPEELVAFRGPHMRGIWRCVGGRYAWIPAGYVEPTHDVGDAEAALRYTLVALATSS